MKDNSEDKALAKTAASLKDLSLSELVRLRKTVQKISRMFGFVGVAAIFVMLAWPGIFSIIVGGIITFVMSNLAISSDSVRKEIEKSMLRFEKA